MRCGDGSVYEANFVVCTVPLGVLKRHGRDMFAADASLLSPRKWQAIERLGRLRALLLPCCSRRRAVPWRAAAMGLENKIMLKFAEAFWVTKEEAKWPDWYMPDYYHCLDFPFVKVLCRAAVLGCAATLLC